MREDDHSRSLERVPGQFSPIRAKKPVYPEISEGTLRVFYILERSSINYLKKRRWYYYVNWNWRKFNRFFWLCKRQTYGKYWQLDPSDHPDHYPDR